MCTGVHATLTKHRYLLYVGPRIAQKFLVSGSEWSGVAMCVVLEVAVC